MATKHTGSQVYRPSIEPYAPYSRLDEQAVSAAAELLQRVGYDLETQHTAMTPYRLVHYLNHWMRPGAEVHLTTFENVSPRIDEIVAIGPVSFWACCSHHLLPFFGEVYFGYIPNGRLVGLSKVPQVIRDVCARPWLQEQMTAHLADLFSEALDPVGIGVITTAKHTCQMLDLQTSDVPQMTFSDVRGAMRGDSAKQEFMRLVGFVR